MSLVGQGLNNRLYEGHKGAYFLTCGRYGIAALNLADARALIRVPSMVDQVPVVRILASSKDCSWFAIIRKDGKVGICRWNLDFMDRKAYEPIDAPRTSAATFVGNDTLVLGSSDGTVTIFNLVFQIQEGRIAESWRTARSREIGKGEHLGDGEQWDSDSFRHHVRRTLPKKKT